LKYYFIAKYPQQAKLYFDEPTIDKPSIDEEELSFDEPIIDKVSIDDKEVANPGYKLKPNRNDANILVDYDSNQKLASKLDKKMNIGQKSVINYSRLFARC
jgi:hypothetical protein